jgi:putative phage-type endonuclease
MDREKWLAERRTGIGGSDVAAALGLDPYCTQRELWEKKLNHLPDSEDTRLTRAGRFMEAAIGDLYAEQFGVTLRKKHVTVVHPKYPILRANIDRLIVGERSGLELKNCDSMVFRLSGEWGPEDTDEIPQRYLLQALTYAMCLDYPQWFVGVLVGGNDLKRYVIHRDAELESLVVDGVHAFWSHVESGEPPPFDYDHPTTLPLLKKLYRGTEGGVIDLPEEAMHWHHVRLEAGLEAKAYEATQDGATAHLLHLMGEAAVGHLSDGTEYVRKMVTRKAYAVEETTYTDFRHRKPKESK